LESAKKSIVICQLFPGDNKKKKKREGGKKEGNKNADGQEIKEEDERS
jgi:hypothetical protein